MCLKFVFVFVIFLLHVHVFAVSKTCTTYFFLRELKESESFEVEEITLELGGSNWSNKRVNSKSFFESTERSQEPIVQEDRIRIFSHQGVQRSTEIIDGILVITNLNTNRRYKLQLEDVNLNGTFTEDHRFWIMPYNKDRFLVWAFSREKNNIAEIFFDEMSEVRSYKYSIYGTTPFIEIHLLNGDYSGGMITKLVYINLYTMKMISREEFLKTQR